MGMAKINEASNLRVNLDNYLASSGQKINEDKSFIFFFNTQLIQSRIAQIVHFHFGSLPLNYLGIPIIVWSQCREIW